jgi:hypothetical protein
MRNENYDVISIIYIILSLSLALALLRRERLGSIADRMKRKPARTLSLDDVDPFEMEGSLEDIAFVEKGIAAWEKKIGRWSAVLAEMKKEAGVAVEVPIKPKAPAMNGIVEKVVRRKPNTIYPTQPIGTLKTAEGSVADVVYKILDAAGAPISYPDFRERFVKTELGKNMLPHDKPYYAGIQRLKKKGYCVNYKGRLSTPAHLKRFLADVAAGRVEDFDAADRFVSKWADAIMEVLRAQHGEWIATRDLVEKIGALPQFKGYKNLYGKVCNALNNLKYRRNLVERTGRENAKGTRWRILAPVEAATESKAKTSEELPLTTH